LLAACSVAEESLPPAELGEVCGEAGPVRVLELQPGERLAETPRASAGRVVYRVGRYGAATASGRAPTPVDVALWSTGPCGESPKEIEPVVQDLLVLNTWPDVLLGHRRQAGELVALDASGATDGNAVFTGLGPSLLFATGHGVVTFEARDEQTGAALFHRYPADPRVDSASGEVIVEGVKISIQEDVVYAGQFQALTDELLIKNLDDELVAVALVDGTVTVERTGVQRFAASPDGRWLLWQALSSDPEDVYLSGKVYLRDRSSGAELSLGDMFLDNTSQPFALYEEGLFVVNADPYYDGVRRVYTLATLAIVDLTDGRVPRHVFADGRWAVGRHVGGGIDLYDPADDSFTPLVSRGDVEWWGARRVRGPRRADVLRRRGVVHRHRAAVPRERGRRADPARRSGVARRHSPRGRATSHRARHRRRPARRAGARRHRVRDVVADRRAGLSVYGAARGRVRRADDRVLGRRRGAHGRVGGEAGRVTVTRRCGPAATVRAALWFVCLAVAELNRARGWSILPRCDVDLFACARRSPRVPGTVRAATRGPAATSRRRR
jgi:hypothetical protein